LFVEATCLVPTDLEWIADPNVLAIALANKLARIAWAVLSNDCDCKCEKTDETPRCA
jgi:hypothetical protein